MDVLQRNYHLSEGKLYVLIQLHQSPEGHAPSLLAERAGITRASVSVMLRHLEEDGLATLADDEEDRRAKRVRLTKKGRTFLDEVLPEHYLRITKLMGRLTAEEQKTLTGLLEKLAS
ncbi:MAG: MarR family transcriptional regulator, partial [Schwartzia sp.]|nr:MarR family transcriptional regulator [Schwartzia sp. (in: firmicutes)]